MPSIRSMFLPPEADNPDFNLDDFLREADEAATGSPARQYALGGNPPAAEGDLLPPTADPVPSGEAGDGDLDAGDEPVSAPVVEPPQFAPPSDPLLNLPPERRASLLALDQIMSTTPGAVDRVYEALRKPEPPRPEPKIPEHVDPESMEAQLWQQNQEILRRMDEQERTQRETQQQTAEQTRLQTAAGQAVANFRTRHPDLGDDDLTTMAGYASQAGFADAFVRRPGVDPVAGYEEALEYTLWKNSSRAYQPAPTPPVTGPPPQNQENKRVLHALSTGAVPVAGPPPARAPLETRGDGRFTPESRGLLVDQLAADLRNSGYK
jgi:hypothetical protein